MKVMCSTVADFLANLDIALVKGDTILQKAVYVDVSDNPIDGTRWGKNPAAKWRRDLQAMAVVQMQDGGEYLLECGVECGTDYRCEGEYPATERAKIDRGFIEAYCIGKGLTVRPGTIEA